MSDGSLTAITKTLDIATKNACPHILLYSTVILVLIILPFIISRVQEACWVLVVPQDPPELLCVPSPSHFLRSLSEFYKWVFPDLLSIGCCWCWWASRTQRKHGTNIILANFIKCCTTTVRLKFVPPSNTLFIHDIWVQITTCNHKCRHVSVTVTDASDEQNVGGDQVHWCVILTASTFFFQGPQGEPGPPGQQGIPGTQVEK